MNQNGNVNDKPETADNTQTAAEAPDEKDSKDHEETPVSENILLTAQIILDFLIGTEKKPLRMIEELDKNVSFFNKQLLKAVEKKLKDKKIKFDLNADFDISVCKKKQQGLRRYNDTELVQFASKAITFLNKNTVPTDVLLDLAGMKPNQLTTLTDMIYENLKNYAMSPTFLKFIGNETENNLFLFNSELLKHISKRWGTDYAQAFHLFILFAIFKPCNADMLKKFNVPLFVQNCLTKGTFPGTRTIVIASVIYLYYLNTEICNRIDMINQKYMKTDPEKRSNIENLYGKPSRLAALFQTCNVIALGRIKKFKIEQNELIKMTKSLKTHTIISTEMLFNTNLSKI